MFLVMPYILSHPLHESWYMPWRGTALLFQTLQQLYERSNFSIHKTFEHKIFKDCLKFTYIFAWNVYDVLYINNNYRYGFGLIEFSKRFQVIPAHKTGIVELKKNPRYAIISICTSYKIVLAKNIE